MNIYAKSGSKVVFLGRNGHDTEADDAKDLGLVTGETYTVESTEVDDWSSYVKLREFENKSFNTVMFEDEGGDED